MYARPHVRAGWSARATRQHMALVYSFSKSTAREATDGGAKGIAAAASIAAYGPRRIPLAPQRTFAKAAATAARRSGTSSVCHPRGTRATVGGDPVGRRRLSAHLTVVGSRQRPAQGAVRRRQRQQLLLLLLLLSPALPCARHDAVVDRAGEEDPAVPCAWPCRRPKSTASAQRPQAAPPAPMGWRVLAGNIQHTCSMVLCAITDVLKAARRGVLKAARRGVLKAARRGVESSKKGC
eukprot:365409-Chlamydomonas_euryale.AAC.6